MKLMTIVGTRPEIIRLSEIIKKADLYFEHVLVHTGQNYDYELNEVFFKDLKIRKPDFYLDCAGKDLGETMGNIISKSYEIIKSQKPDAILILGDTNSALSAISAKRLKTPIFHMEAGNRCWDWNVSEMINRRIVDVISDVNLPYTENSRLNLINEGVDPKTIFVTGSPMYEVINNNLSKINKSKILEELELEKKNYYVLSAHREETVDDVDKFTKLVNCINELAVKGKKTIVFSVHPRTRKQIDKLGISFEKNVLLIKPLGLLDYCSLEKNSYCVLSDSGTLSEESAILGFPAVLIRTSTERSEALDSGTIVMSKLDIKELNTSISLAISELRGGNLINPAYRESDVSTKVIKIIQSYTHIVNLTTWGKKE